MKTAEEILESNFYRPKETLEHYDNIITCMEDYHSQFKFYTVKQMEELREHAYQLGIKHGEQNYKQQIHKKCEHDFTEGCFNRSDEFMYYLCSKCGEQQH